METFWEWGDLYDALVTPDGKLILLAENGETSKHPLIACLDAKDPQSAPAWVQEHALVKDVSNGSQPRLALDRQGRLLVWSADKHTLSYYSLADGSPVGKVGGKEAGQFSLKGCNSLAVDTEGTWLTGRTLTAQAGDTYGGLVRYTPDGREAAVWPQATPQVAPKVGFFKRLFGAPEPVATGRPCLRDVGPRFLECHESEVQCSVGEDGTYFVWLRYHLARFTRDGRRLYSVEAPGIEGRVLGDRQGRAYLIGGSRYEDLRVMCVAADGSQLTDVANSPDGRGLMYNEDVLARAADGRLFAVGDSSGLRVFSAQGECLFMSPSSQRCHDRRARQQSSKDAEEDE